MQNLTNVILPNDGFGANLQMLLYTLMYCEFNNISFSYTPFTKMLHTNDIELLENMINFKKHFPIVNKTENYESLNVFQLLSFYEKNLELCSNSKSLKLVKKIFKESNENPYDKNYKNVAIHIRRYIKNDRTKIGADVPDYVYIDIINQISLLYKNVKIHIYSLGNIEDFKKIYTKENIIFHLNEKLDKTFIGLVYADILVIAPSALSYTAGLISDSLIYYIKFCNPPLKHWNIIQNYTSSRIKHEYLIPILTSVFYDPITEKFEKNIQ